MNQIKISAGLLMLVAILTGTFESQAQNNSDPNMSRDQIIIEEILRAEYISMPAYKKKEIDDHPHMFSIVDKLSQSAVGKGKETETAPEIIRECKQIKYLEKKVEELQKNRRQIFDFGNSRMSGSELWVSFSDNFRSIISADNIPVITVTSNDPAVNLSVTEKDGTGFKVVASPRNVSNISFDWIIVAKIKK